VNSEKNNVFKNINFESFFQNFIQIIKQGFEKFWEAEIDLQLLAINDFKSLREEFFIKNLNFFSSQIIVEKHKPIIIRLDENFLTSFLDNTFAQRTEKFNIKTLTPLEIKILNVFCEFLYKQFQNNLIPIKNLKLTSMSEEKINFIFNIAINDLCSKMVISIPKDRINFTPIEYKTSFNDEDFLNSYTYVKIRAGYTKLTLEELQNISIGDIVLLEDSISTHLTLISGGLEKKFKVEIDDSLILDIDNNETNIQKENNVIDDEVIMKKNLWDDIQIEISAEFSKVKMTIGELKQITKGQIVDLGSVFENEISLYVENKKVAKGELIIINDKYAVRLNEVLSSIVEKETINTPKIEENKKEIQEKKPQAETGKKPEVKPQAQIKQTPVEDEEFDYSDFEK